MYKHKKHKTFSYGIVGIGRFGFWLATELAAAGANLVVLDRNEDKIRQMREYTENAFVVNSLDKNTLADTGIQNCDVAIVCIGEHIDTSILTTLELINLGVPQVIAKANSTEHGEVLERLGAKVIFPERDMAIRLANRLEASRVLDIVGLSEKINISKLEVPKAFIGKSVIEINLRKEFGLNIIAVESNGNIIDVINPDYVFAETDILYLSGSRENILALSDWIAE